MQFLSFFLQQFSPQIDEPEITREDVIRLVAQKIEKMLEYNTEKLLHLADRIDTDEEEFKACFDHGSEEQIAYRIAELFYEREFQKWEMRSRK